MTSLERRSRGAAANPSEPGATFRAFAGQARPASHAVAERARAHRRAQSGGEHAVGVHGLCGGRRAHRGRQQRRGLAAGLCQDQVRGPSSAHRCTFAGPTHRVACGLVCARASSLTPVVSDLQQVHETLQTQIDGRLKQLAAATAKLQALQARVHELERRRADAEAAAAATAASAQDASASVAETSGQELSLPPPYEDLMPAPPEGPAPAAPQPATLVDLDDGPEATSPSTSPLGTSETHPPAL